MKQKITLLLLFFLVSLSVNAQSFLVTFPNHDAAPTQNPRNLTVCEGTSMLKVRLDVAAASTTGASVTIQLPPGVEYLPGTVTKTNGTPALTIADNGGGANAPNFSIGPNALIPGQFIEFTVTRKATCAARTASIAGTAFSDIVSGTISGNNASMATSSAYQLFYPVFSFTQPATQTNAVVGASYTRNFTISNGGNGCATAVYFSIENVSNGTQQTGITLGGVTIVPTSTVGNTSYYTVTASNLPGGDFCFGETLTFTETYVVKACNAITNYSAGWGCSEIPADWCQTVSASASVAMGDGSASLTSFTVAKLNYVNDCTPFQYTFQFVTAGSGTTNASAMFDAIFRVGGSAGATMGTGALLNSVFQLSNLNYNGHAIPVVYASPGNHLRIVVKDLFTSDPDGGGVGLEDLDGDGFYDDLLPNSSIIFTTDVNMNLAMTCPISLSGYWGYRGDILYGNMCNEDKISVLRGDTHNGIDRNTLSATNVSEILEQADNSYAPANIFGGVPFRMRFAESWYSMGTINYNPNQRYEWQVTLPPGVEISGTGNIVWANGKDIATVPTLTPTYNYNPATRVLTVLSPGVDMGMFFLDLVYDCASGPAGAVTIPYTVSYINDSTTNCRTFAPMFCGSEVLANVVCPNAPCPDGGVTTTFLKVEREDNSLGWTDSSMTTHQTRANISSYDLSKSLYLDEFFVTANGVQQTVASDNLYIKMGLKKLVAQSTDIVAVKSIDIQIKRAGTTIASGTLPSSFALNTGSTNTVQLITWELTSLLPAGGILPGDVIETVSHYNVIAGDGALPITDNQTGDSFKIYNIIGGVERACNGLIPEMYLVGTVFRYSGGIAGTLSGCGQASWGLTASRNFSSAGNKYLNEFRPGFAFTGMDIFIPTTLTLVNYNGLTPTTVTPVTGGTLYHFDYTSERIVQIIAGNGSADNTVAGGTITVSGNCSTVAVNSIQVKAYGQNYLYHYRDLPVTNPHTNAFPTSGSNFSNNIVLKPEISISNQSGTVQASRPTESAIVRVSSTGGSTASYIWLKVPTQQGITITEVVNVATNAVATPIVYAGGVWFQVSTAGIAPGSNENYRLDFTYTTCVAGAIHVEAGWDCTGYPETPDEYICTPISVNLPFIPQTAEVQIITVTQPSDPVDLCTAIPFEYRMNSAGAGNTINNTFVVELPVGMSYAGPLEAEYPVGSGSWAAVATNNAGTQTTVDLTTHPNFPAQGLPGTLTDLGDANSRLIGLRFSLSTSCDFIAGSKTNIFARANRSCGAPATGNGTSSPSLDINIDGITAEYIIESSVVPSGTFTNCNNTVNYTISQTIVSPTPLGTTATTQVILPTGFSYIAGSLVCNDPDLTSSAPYACPAYLGTFTNTAGQDYAEFSVPSGLVSGDKLNFTIGLQQATTVACGDYSLLVQTVDKVASVSCPSAPGGVCNNFTIETGSVTLPIKVEKPELEIVSVNYQKEIPACGGDPMVPSKLIVSVKNNSLINQTNASPANPVIVQIFAADVAGQPMGAALATYTMTGPIVAGATVTETVNGLFNTTVTDLVAVIDTTQNCVCSLNIFEVDVAPIATCNALCYTQGSSSVPVNVLANDTTGDTVVATTVSLVVQTGATGVVTDANGDVTSMTITGQGTWNVDPVTGVIYFAPLTSITINPTPVYYTVDDAEGNTSNIAKITLTAAVSLSGTVTAVCVAGGSTYTVTATLNGLAPFTATGTGAPGTWVGSIWTSSPITSGTNYNINFQDVNACSALNITGISPVCCAFQVICPTFPATTVACYSAIPVASVLTETQFEALGNGNGVIGNNPCGVIVITASNAAAPACEGNVIRTYTITEYADTNNNDVRDAGENTILNSTTCSQTFTIERADFTVPANTASTVACASAIVAPTLPTVTDNCGNVLTASAPVISSAPACEGNVTYTYTFTDCEGNTHNWMHTFTIERADFTIPANTASTVACASAIVAPTLPTVTDNCGNVLTASAPVISSAPACEGNVTYTYTFTDCEGNTHNWMHTFTIERADFTVPANTASTVACASAITAPTVPVVTDNCGNVLTASAPVISSAPACEGNVTYTYTFTDCEGNTHNWMHTFTIERADFTVPANTASTVACASAIVAPALPTVTDNCGNVLTASAPVISSAPACEGNVTYTYTFTDCEGNTHNWVYTYTIERLDFSMPANGSSTVACAANIVAPTVPVVTDNCGNILTASAPVISAAPACEGNVTYTYAFTDCEGNTHNWVYTYTIERLDFSMPANGSSTVACAANIVAPTVPVVTDNCGNILTASAPVISAAPACEGNVTYTYAFTDCEGNTHNWVYTYTIERLDFSMPANGSSTVACASAITAPTVPVITDNCGDILTASAPVISAAPACEGNVTYTYAFTDCEGNTHNWVYTYIIEMLDFSMPANGSSTVACASAITAPTVPVVTDNCGNILTASAPVISSAPACEGNVTYTYTFTDCEGNTHDWVYTYTIERLDFTMPANGAVTVQCISEVVAPTVPVVTDNCGNILTASAPVISAAPACEGNVTYTYTFTDCEGNTHNWVYTYTIDDVTAPTGTAPANITLQCIDDVPAADIDAVTDEADNCSGSVTVTVSDTSNGGTGCTGNAYILTRTYTLTDCSGLSTNLVQTITVEDTTAPAFTEVLPQDAVFSCDAPIPAAVTLTATDNCSVATVTFDEQIVNAGCIGNYDIIRTWTATDACGNETVHIQTIMVEDTTAPTFVEPLPENEFAECDKLPAAPVLTAIDNCGTATVTFNEEETDGTCSFMKVITRTWTATDDCGNSISHTQTIDVSCPVIVYNALTPNEDGLNDIFLLDGIDCYPNNQVTIFNRWGVEVFGTRGYDNTSKVFKGYSEGRTTISADSKLPTGTYFYILKYEFKVGETSRNIEKSGHLYINGN
ncbi:gliding motility-associated C-terminal domain-containing protein [Flavobacterium qiangtangense]|uniref:Gliding motility-associated C-terminal domain-containing protein n=1 Tax=Flavobacterium qiangtangense TaxID=1442595 RepID=A0ABW1PT45_9FLAO